MGKYFLYILLFSLTLVGYSQEKEDLKAEKVTIIKSYTPEIVNAQKEDILPSEQKQVSKFKTNYNLLKLPNTYKYTPNRIEPLEADFILNKEQTKKDDYIGILYLGYANYNTLYGEGFISDFIDEDKILGISMKYLSSDGKSQSPSYNMDFRDFDVKGFYNQYWNDYFFKGNLNYQRNEISYYGIPSYIDVSNYSDIQPSDMDLSNDYARLDFKGYFSNYATKDTSRTHIFNFAKINVGYFEDLYYTNEFNIDVETNLQLEIEDILFCGDFKIEHHKSVTFVHETITDLNATNYIFAPYIKYLSKGFDLNLGASVYYNISNHEKNKLKIYPKVKLEYSPSSDIFTLFSTIEGGYKLNGFNKVTKINPWISAKNFDMFSSNILYDLSLGIKGKIITNWNYKAGARYKHTEDDMLWITNIDYTEQEKSEFPNIAFTVDNSFQSLRATTNLLELFFKSEYQISTGKDVGIRTSFFVSDADSTKYLYQPNFDIEAYTNLEFLDTWQFSLFAKYIGSRYAMSVEEVSGNKIYKEQELDGFIDVNLQVSYILNREFSLFIKLNNIVNQKYQIYYNYDSFGICVMGGLSYRF